MVRARAFTDDQRDRRCRCRSRAELLLVEGARALDAQLVALGSDGTGPLVDFFLSPPPNFRVRWKIIDFSFRYEMGGWGRERFFSGEKNLTAKNIVVGFSS